MTTKYEVILTADAVQDLEELYDYILTHDLPGKADYVLKNVEESFDSLSNYPERGSYPKELLYLGIREYREIYFKPYRIIYKISEQKVYIFLMVDGRRDLQTLLQLRLFRD